jgi:hypothetical protein
VLSCPSRNDPPHKPHLLQRAVQTVCVVKRVNHAAQARQAAASVRISRNKPNITDTNRIHLVLFGMQSRTLRPKRQPGEKRTALSGTATKEAAQVSVRP